ncbi:MAG: NAD-dependent epimerase/dehydratase family protein [Syntrophaceae bacterium]|nr:NAD-dependent epimerase/dehydratase family protein [Syntrophaceae bacterium]
MKTLITGGAGFIGSHLADLLVSENYDVVAVDNLSLGTKKNIRHLACHKRFKFIKEDLLHIDKLKDIFQKNRFDVVFHLAANSDIAESESNPEIDLNNTFMTTYNVLECCRLFHVDKFVFASSSAVYGDSDEDLSEKSCTLCPISYYGAGKLAAESFISAYSFMNNIRSWIIRFPNVVGERITHGVIHDFIKKLKNNPKQLEILGDGNQKKPYMYVKDLVEAILFIYQSAKERLNYYNVGVKDETTVTEIAKIVCKEMKFKNVKFKYTGGTTGWRGDVPFYQYDLKKINSLGWEAKYSSTEAIKLAVRSILNK